MAKQKSLATAAGGVVTYAISIDGKELEASYLISSIVVFKSVNKISSAKIKVSDGASKGLEGDFNASASGSLNPGKEIKIEAGYNSKNKVIFEGIIIKHGLRVSNRESVVLIECKDKAVSLTVGRKNAVFLKKKDSDIINDILKEYPSLTKSIAVTNYEHSEVVQHYISDWDFIISRADVNGMIVVTDSGKITLQLPEVDAATDMVATNGSDVIGFQGEIDARNQVSKVSSVGWDMSSQKILTSTSSSATEVPQSNLKSSDLAKVIGLNEYVLQTSSSVPVKVLDDWAKAKHAKAALSKVKSKVEVQGNPDSIPGGSIKLEGFSEQFNGAAFISAVEHRIEDGDWSTTLYLGLSPSWYTEEVSNIDAAPASGLFSPVKGLQTAKVKQVDQDKDGQYRVKIALPTLGKDNLMVWARLSNFYSSKDAGLFFYPEVDDEVVIGFLNEDPQNAIILGSVYSSEIKPAYTPEAENYIKALVTKGQLKIEFDDEKKIITIMTPGENVIIMDDDKKSITIEDKANKNKVVMDSAGITMETDTDITLKAKGNIALEAKGNIEMKATGDVKTEGMNVESKGKTKFAAEGAQAELKGSAQTTIKGGMIMIN